MRLRAQCRRSSTTSRSSTTRRSSARPGSTTRPTTGHGTTSSPRRRTQRPRRRNRRVRLAGDRRRGHDLANLALIWQQGGEIVEDGSSVGFDGPSGEAALGVVAQAAADGSVYIDSTAGSERMQQLFASGKMAMNVAGPYTLPEYVDAKVDYGVVSMPSFGDEHTTIAGPDTWAIFDSGEERVAAAIEFMDWFSEPEQRLRWITEARHCR